MTKKWMVRINTTIGIVVVGSVTLALTPWIMRGIVELFSLIPHYFEYFSWVMGVTR